MNLIIPSKLTLMPFQVEAVNKMLCFLKSNKGVYNACDLGLGKTVMTIASVNTLKCKKVLVICPAIMCLVWEKEIKKWAVGNAEYTVLSYNKAVQLKNTEELVKVKWDCLINDEVHFLKSSKAKRTKIILGKIWPCAVYHICLSGTPFTQSIVDGYNIFHRLNPIAFPDYMQFAYRYAYVKRTPWGDKFFGVKHAEELKNIIRNSFYIRYKKEDVLKELPPKRFTRISLPESYAVKPPADQALSLKEAIEAIKAKIERGEPVSVVPTHIAAIKKLQGLKKCCAIIEFVQDLLDQSIPVVLFAYHRDVISEYEKAFSKHAPIVITGDTSAVNRQQGIESFQAGKTDLFIGQMIASGIGITLTRSSNVVLAEVDWSPSSIQQAVSRTHRIGQLSSVNIFYFVVDGSIEEKIIEVVMEKAKTFSAVVEINEDTSRQAV